MKPQLTVDAEWTHLLSMSGQAPLIDALRDYLPRCRWFQSKARTIEQISILDTVPVENTPTHLLFLEVTYVNDIDEMYVLPIKFVFGQTAQAITEAFSTAAIISLRCQQDGEMVDGFLIDAIYDERFRAGMLDFIGSEEQIESEIGSLDAGTTRAFAELNESQLAQQSKLLGREQSNTSFKYGDVLVLKLMRKIEEGINPELEIGRFLTEETAITHVPLLAGYVEYRHHTKLPATVAVLQGFVHNQGDAWEFTLNWLSQWFQSGILDEAQSPPIPDESLVSLAQHDIPTEAQQYIGDYLDKARLLGQRTAELHIALASGRDEKFRPMDFSMSYQEELHASIVRMSDRVFAALGNRIGTLPDTVIEHGRAVLNQEQEIRRAFKVLAEQDIPGKRIRGHGDYHLGQVLYTGTDFVIVDFEGEPARPMLERYIKHSPLRDVAGMLRSFHYAAYGTLPGFGLESLVPQQLLDRAEPRARYWRTWVSVAFLKGYLEHIDSAKIIPSDIDDLDLLLQILVMEKAVYELGYEINNRPGWLKVPAQAIIRQIH